MCKVSIIVPLYNGEKTIARCLDSLTGQTIRDVEIVVVDDGSKDDGAKIVRQYMKKDERIRLITQRNAGAGTARNRGVMEAKGEFVGFVDCDDFVHKRMYEILSGVLEEKQVSIAVCQEKNVYIEDGNIRFINETKFPIQKSTVYTNEQILDWFLNFSYLSLNSMCYKLVKRSVFMDHGIAEPENFRYAEDMVTSAALFSHVDKVAIVPKGLYYYVHAKASASYHYSLRHAVDVYTDWKEIRQCLEECGYNGSISNFSLGMTFSSLKQLYWAEEKAEKPGSQIEKLKSVWKRERRKYGWKPDFKAADIPFAHKIKILTAYLHLERAMCLILKKLSWIPFFNFMA